MIRRCINEAFKSQKLQRMYDENGGFDNYGGSIQGWTNGDNRVPLSDIEDDDIEDIVNLKSDRMPDYNTIKFKNGNYAKLKPGLEDKYSNSYEKRPHKQGQKENDDYVEANSYARGNRNIALAKGQGRKQISPTEYDKQTAPEFHSGLMRNVMNNINQYKNDMSPEDLANWKKYLRTNLDNRKNGNYDIDISAISRRTAGSFMKANERQTRRKQ